MSNLEITATPAVDQPREVQKEKVEDRDVAQNQEVQAGVITDIEPGEKPALYSKMSTYLMMIFSGLALGSDGYNAAVIGSLTLLLKTLYPEALTTSMRSRLSNAFLIGMIVGMIGFGVVVDQLGRKTGAVVTTLVLLLGIAMSAAANGTTQLGVMWMLVVARGVAGVGAGGEYPVSGAGALEASDESGSFRKRRGFLFALIGDLSAGLGYCFGALVPMLLLLCVHQKTEHYQLVWRLSLALGAIPPMSIFWFRLRMRVSTAYRKSALRKQKTPYVLIVKKYWRRLLGAIISWFLYNWISIPFGIFSSTIIARGNPSNSLVQNLGWGCLINSFYLPGPFIGGYLSDRIGRRKTMALGYTLQAVLGFILGGASSQIQSIFPLFVVLYATEPFPTSVRGHTMGFISAFSKAGAAIGTEVFTAIMGAYVDPEKGNQVAFLVGSAFAVLGALNAWFVVQNGEKHLEDEDRIWKEYLVQNGWDASWGDRETQDPAATLKQKLEQTS
ncbi:uncharacterized protein E0L32_001600 [Thyridium curvatum]|uniref:Major facilitator superfamily (MFS) profile domain-containing protein n=1 Tax=Thyridium curvatum TaxID=1093900 RepID=A0A507AP57_9PEZI|nr:uncharacterized protein E0L32_001597 [Thyridium curvatum]XP_030990851.1 uncharacterized protein E0L32_001600 [Thyridium curvatum]TPX09137.1 hypothetical protein E0L32_001597 [Thyridium curvatum]TPX09140.1 hypothetical protein E0L32_001600 [Thyridium curvatum]